MFKNVRQVTYSAPDLSAAGEWYAQLLEKEPVFESPFAVLFQIDGIQLALLPSENQNTPLSSSVVFWQTESADHAFQQLTAKGALPIKHPETVMNSRSAVVCDPWGNCFGVHSPERSAESSDSQTAQFTAFCRALFTFENREELKSYDPLALLFLSEHYRKGTVDESSREWSKKRIGALYGYLLARTRCIDDLFMNAHGRGFEQIVTLGAGYDCRAVRFCSESTAVFETDLAVTQNRKRDILKKNGILPPETLRFVPMDFQKDSVSAGLRNAGYMPKRTLFIGEGVVPYLTEQAVYRSLKEISEISVPGSMLFFDYLTEEQSSQHDAEPFQFWMTPQRAEMILVELGYRIDFHCSSALIEKRWLSTHSGEILEPSMPCFAFICGVKI